jgi:predicted acyltransferase
LNQRFYSLDIFRGATVAFMILVNNPGDWSHIFSPLEHAPWHGCTPTDFVFPFFLFAVGNAMAFVFAKSKATTEILFLEKVLQRAFLIFAIGLFLNWFPFVRWEGDHLVFKNWVNPKNPDEGIRILGVLQRIALSYLFASIIIHYFKIRGAMLCSLLLLFGYWSLCLLFGKPGDPYSINGYFGLQVDKAVLGAAHMYKGEGVPFDPEGLASTLPAIVQVIFGYFVSYYILNKGKTYEMLAYLFTLGSLFLFAGYCWDMLFPINKKIWSSSFVVYTSGMATIVLCVGMYLVEFKNKKGLWCTFFEAFGKNPLFIFVLSGLVPRLLGLVRWNIHADTTGKINYDSPLAWFYQHVCMPVSSNLAIGSLLYALITVAFYWLISYVLDKKNIYVRV